MAVQHWMSWEGGVDLVAMTREGLEEPNLILHVARVVHTPVGSAPAGMILFQPDPAAPPEVMGFLSPAPEVAAYFGPTVFAGTPFQQAPALEASIEISHADGSAEARVEVAGKLFVSRMRDLAALEAHDRPAESLPFQQRVLEAVAGSVTLSVDDQPVELSLPPVGLSGGAPAVWSSSGIYSR